MKPWVYSDQSGRREPRGGKMESKTMILPNQLTEEDNKALGYTIEDDKLHVMVAVNFSKKKKKCTLSGLTKRRSKKRDPRSTHQKRTVKPSLWSL